MSRADLSIAINSVSGIDVNFININGGASGVGITVNAGTKVSFKCSGKGSGSPKWSWKFTNLYTELTDHTSSTNNLDGMSGYEDFYVFSFDFTNTLIWSLVTCF